MAVADPIWGDGKVSRLPVALEARPASLRDGAAIPPREWLYGTILIRRYVSLIVAPGGVGKTAWSIGCLCSLASGRALIGDYVHARVNVLSCGLEDPEDEFDRRIAAFMRRHDLDDEDLAGRIWTINGRERHLTIAAMAEDGTSICYPDKEPLVALIRRHQIGVVAVDPFVNSHELDENSNPHINAAARAWAEIANDTGCAVLLVHHTRKGAAAGDIEGARGASALIGAARAALTLSAMTPEDARLYGVSERDRRLHVRLDDAKANLAPPSEKARWFRLASVALGNGTQDYPNGDNVQAIETWEPPALLSAHPVRDLNRALSLIAEGPEPGMRYARSKRGGGDRWAGLVLMDVLAMNEEQASKTIAQWCGSGLLMEEAFVNPKTRKEALGLTVDDAKRPSE